jgi:hypothetical protein
MHRWFACGLIAAISSVTALAVRSQVSTSPPRLSVPDAVSMYARGEFDAAVNGLDKASLDLAPFTRALDEWIRTGDRAAEQRRGTAAVAFALETVWAATRTFWHARTINTHSGHLTPGDPERMRLDNADVLDHIASWAIEHLASASTPNAVDRALWLATLGVAEDGHAWDLVEHDMVPLASKRFPDEPRFRMAGVLARTTKLVGPLRIGRWGSGRRHDVLRNETMPARGIDEAIKLFAPLLADAGLSGEVELRIGYFELRRDKWANALARFDAARTKASEPVLRATADYFGGWVYEQQNRPDEAIAAYRRAHAIAPLMRNLTMRLSALLFMQNQRAEAYALLDRAVSARPVQTDLLVTLERADARFVPDWFASIRRALQ